MLQHPMARATYAMFLVAEVHPFSDGRVRVNDPSKLLNTPGFMGTKHPKRAGPCEKSG